MTDSKTNVKKLNPSERADFVRKLNDNLELLDLQANIADARARIKKANLEELIYAIKINELENPTKENGKS